MRRWQLCSYVPEKASISCGAASHTSANVHFLRGISNTQRRAVSSQILTTSFSVARRFDLTPAGAHLCLSSTLAPSLLSPDHPTTDPQQSHPLPHTHTNTQSFLSMLIIMNSQFTYAVALLRTGMDIPFF